MISEKEIRAHIVSLAESSDLTKLSDVALDRYYRAKLGLPLSFAEIYVYRRHLKKLQRRK